MTSGNESIPAATTVRAPQASPASAVELAPGSVSIPETADAALKVILQGLHENHPDILWDSLPASYQRDVNELVHLFANRLHPEAWRWFLQIADKGAGRMRLLATIPEERNDFADGGEAAEDLNAFVLCADELARLSQCGPAGLEQLKSADTGMILRNEGRRLMSRFRNFLKLFGAGVFSAPFDDPGNVRIGLKKSDADGAIVEFETPGWGDGEIDFVRVEGKWVPRALADHWQTAIARVRNALLDAMPSSNATDNFGVPFRTLAFVDFWADPPQDEVAAGIESIGLGDIVPSLTQSLILLGYLYGGPPTIEPDFQTKAKESLAAKGKVTLVYCYAPKEVRWDNESVDFDLAKHVAYQLNAKQIKVVDPDRVYAWLDKHDRWRKTAEIGAAFKADYIVHIDVKDYSLTEANSNRYQGRADCIVNVVKMDESKRDGTVIYAMPIKSIFPKNGPVDQGAISHQEFKKRYLLALSWEIGKLFCSSETADDIPSAKEGRTATEKMEHEDADGLDQWLDSPKYGTILRQLGVH
jgi:hypothetical protein